MARGWVAQKPLNNKWIQLSTGVGSVGCFKFAEQISLQNLAGNWSEAVGVSVILHSEIVSELSKVLCFAEDVQK